jgi:hypothetical protein
LPLGLGRDIRQRSRRLGGLCASLVQAAAGKQQADRQDLYKESPVTGWDGRAW